MRSLFLLILLTGCFLSTIAQKERSPHFLGLNPSITVEPFYEKGEMDINILPFVYQKPITRRADLRVTTILNLGIRNKGNDISHFGAELAMPLFLKKKEDKANTSEGFFIAPVASFTRNKIAGHNNLGLWIEPGYHLLFDNRVAMSFGLQLGTTFFAYDDGQTKWGNHFGVKVIIGKWL